MCSNKGGGGGCMMCNCTIQHEPPTPTKSDTQFLCKEHANIALPTKDNLSVPTKLHITNSISSFPDEPASQSPMTMNTTCELKEAVCDFNFPVVNGSREFSTVTAPTVVDQQVLQCFTSLPEVNLNIDNGIPKGTRMSYVKNIKSGIKNSSMNTMQTPTANKAQKLQSEDLTDLLTPSNHQTYVNTVQKPHCETSV